MPPVEPESAVVGEIRAYLQPQSTALSCPADEVLDEATPQSLSAPRRRDKHADEFGHRSGPHRRCLGVGADEMTANVIADSDYKDKSSRICDQVGAPSRTVCARPIWISQVISRGTILGKQRGIGLR